MHLIRRAARASLFVITAFLMLLTFPILAQSMTGTYRGTYTYSWPQAACTFTFTGQMDASVTQSGRDLRGSIVISHFQYPTTDGLCKALKPAEPGILGLEDGRNDNGVVGGDLIVLGLHPPFRGTFNGTTWSGSTQGTGSGNFTARISFELTRISTDVRPVVTVLHFRNHATATGGASMYWASAGATTVRLGAEGSLGPFGHFHYNNVPATKVFTLTATGSNGLTASASTTIVTARLPDPDVVLSASPAGMLQGIGAPSATTNFTLTNFGGMSTDVSVAPSGAFFTATPMTFALAPLQSQVVTLTAAAQQAGAHQGSVAITGNGVSTGLSLPVTLLLAAAPPAPVIVTSEKRVEVGGPAGTNPNALLSFTNHSVSTVDGLLSTDVPWIVIPDAHVTLGPGQTKFVAASIDRSRRTGPALGGATGEVVFRHFSALPTGDSGNVAAVFISVLDIITSATPIPLQPSGSVPGSRYVFAPGASRKPASFSDLTITNTSRPASHIDGNITFFPHGPANGAMFHLAIPANGSIVFPRTLQHFFSQFSEEGVLMTTGTAQWPVFDLRLTHNRVHTNAGLTAVTRLPTFRSDQGYAKGADLFLTGLQKSDARSTTIYLQEMAVADASVTVDFFSSEGARIGASRSYTLSRAGSIEIEDVVPKNATSARIRNNTEGALINAFALVFDQTSAELLPISASGPGTGDLICPAFSAATGTRELFLYLGNASDGAITATATMSELAYETGGRRRAVSHGWGDIETDAGPFAIPALGSRRLRVTGDGVVRLTGPSALRVTAAVTVPGTVGAGRAGSTVPVVPVSAAQIAGANNNRRFSEVEDSSPATISAKRAGTYRSHLMLAEVSGKKTYVNITLRYTFAGGNPNDGADIAVDYVLAPNSVTVIADVARTLLGALGASYGDLHNAIIDIEIQGSQANNGAVMSFLQVVDNGTGDITIQ